ncbi:MAG: type II toxin-antitoxin system RelE/ParE family toxin [Methanobrevibacter sp.]|nr:type II toxin-antitoxin system RelE/ParE family toxin [Candidatus Methanovirga procula]
MKKDTAYKLIIKSYVDKFLDKLSKKDRKGFIRIITKIREILDNPYKSIILKTDDKDCIRVKVGKYRVLFRISKSDKIIIERIGKRSKIYKNLRK